MADEIPPAPSESDDVTKNETIRITLPPKSEQPAVKRETVRINVPAKTGETPLPPAGVAPKKETSKLPTTGAGLGAAPTAPPPAAAPTKPFMPPPPGAPKPPGGIGAPPPKPLSGVNPPPKPPGMGVRPTVPLKPVAPTADAVTMKAAAPKKETARITLPPEGTTKPALPKATVKMQQTQPLVNRPQSSIQPSPLVTAAPAASLHSAPAADGAIAPLAIAVLLLALVGCALVFLAYSAASPAL